jgi:hypothetical protein
LIGSLLLFTAAGNEARAQTASTPVLTVDVKAKFSEVGASAVQHRRIKI